VAAGGAPGGGRRARSSAAGNRGSREGYLVWLLQLAADLPALSSPGPVCSAAAASVRARLVLVRALLSLRRGAGVRAGLGWALLVGSLGVARARSNSSSSSSSKSNNSSSNCGSRDSGKI